MKKILQVGQKIVIMYEDNNSQIIVILGHNNNYLIIYNTSCFNTKKIIK